MTKASLFHPDYIRDSINFEKNSIDKMRIAIPTDDTQTIAKHFGRAKGFMTFETKDDKVSSEAYNPNNFTGHARGLHHHAHGHHLHSHKSIFEALDGCEIVIAMGMGRRLLDDFSAK